MIKNASEFAAALSFASVAMGSRNFRHCLNGVHIKAESARVLLIEATDGHTATRLRMDVDALPADLDVIVKNDSVKALIAAFKKSDRELTLVPGEHGIQFTDGTTSILAGLIDDIYLDTDRIWNIQNAPEGAAGISVNPAYLANFARGAKALIGESGALIETWDAGTVMRLSAYVDRAKWPNLGEKARMLIAPIQCDEALEIDADAKARRARENDAA